MRGLILKDLYLGGYGRKLGHNVIFDASNVACLAKHLYALRVDEVTLEDEENDIEEMETMIRKYSAFEKHVPGPSPAPKGHVIILTGSTGSLGARILALLLTRSDVRNVYCLVRGGDVQENVAKALRQRGLSVGDTTLLVALILVCYLKQFTSYIMKPRSSSIGTFLLLFLHPSRPRNSTSFHHPRDTHVRPQIRAFPRLRTL